MSSRNEHYLETISRLQKEKDELKEVIDVMTNAWMNSDERKMVVDTFNARSQDNTAACDKDLSVSEGDCIDIANHERDDLFRED